MGLRYELGTIIWVNLYIMEVFAGLFVHMRISRVFIPCRYHFAQPIVLGMIMREINE